MWINYKNPARPEYGQGQLADGAFTYFRIKILSIVEHLSFITVKHAAKKNGE